MVVSTTTTIGTAIMLPCGLSWCLVPAYLPPPYAQQASWIIQPGDWRLSAVSLGRGALTRLFVFFWAAVIQMLCWPLCQPCCQLYPKSRERPAAGPSPKLVQISLLQLTSGPSTEKEGAMISTGKPQGHSTLCSLHVELDFHLGAPLSMKLGRTGKLPGLHGWAPKVLCPCLLLIWSAPGEGNIL